MSRRRNVLLVVALVGMLAWSVGHAWGIGFILGETKEQLKLRYDVEVQDHGTGRVTVVLTVADEGRLRPLDEVQLVIPAKEKNKDGSSWMDLVVSMEMVKVEGGKRVGRVHVLRELAERAEIQLNTHTMDGKVDPMTRLHHVIPIAKYLKSAAGLGFRRTGFIREEAGYIVVETRMYTLFESWHVYLTTACSKIANAEADFASSMFCER